MVFAVSDVKEGWHKEFFDGIEVFDEHLPLLLILDYTKSDRHGAYKFIYPATEHYTFSSSLSSNEITVEDITHFASSFVS